MDFSILAHYLPQQWVILPSNYPTILITVFFAALCLSRSLRQNKAGPRIPRIASANSWFASRGDFAKHGIEIIQRGFEQVESGVFRVTSLDGEMPFTVLVTTPSAESVDSHTTGSDLVILAPRHWLHLCKKKDDEIAPAREEVWSLQYATLDRIISN
jgi:hypothetical protein